MRLVLRLFLFSLYIGMGLVLALSLSIVYGKRWYLLPEGQQVKRWWIRGLGGVLGLCVRVHGRLPTEPMLCIANHISWLDVIAIGATVPSAFIAKDDVQRWPVLGGLMARAGTIFIKRDSLRGLNESIRVTAARLRQGQSVTVFPEGTTTDGVSVNKFRGGLFQAAIDAGVAVQPIAIYYRQRDSGGEIDRMIAPYIGEERFFCHLMRVLRQGSVHVTLHFLNPLEVDARWSRRQVLSARSFELIGRCLAQSGLHSSL